MKMPLKNKFKFALGMALLPGPLYVMLILGGLNISPNDVPTFLWVFMLLVSVPSFFIGLTLAANNHPINFDENSWNDGF